MASIACLFLECSVTYSNPGHSFYLTMMEGKGGGKRESGRMSLVVSYSFAGTAQVKEL
jgi:hypothetical protein